MYFYQTVYPVSLYAAYCLTVVTKSKLRLILQVLTIQVSVSAITDYHHKVFIPTIISSQHFIMEYLIKIAPHFTHNSENVFPHLTSCVFDRTHTQHFTHTLHSLLL